MAFLRQRARLRATLSFGALLCGTAVRADPSIPMAYCASVNSATMDANHSIYQSDGLCYGFCLDDYALAVVQGDACWCADLVPDKTNQVPVSECDLPCPGYPSDVCGAASLYGYMALTKDPSGTFTGSTPASTSAPDPSSTSQRMVVTSTLTLAGPPTLAGTSTHTSTSGQSRTSLTSSSSSSTTSAGTTSPPATPIVQTVTVGGTVQTVTATPTDGLASQNQAPITSHKSGLATGAAVGIAIGVAAVVIGAAIVAFLLWQRKRRRQQEDLFAEPSPRGSSAGMMGSPKAAEAGASSPFARQNGDANPTLEHTGKRRSFLMPIDPRIDPAYSGFYNRDENKSHDSIHTLRDDQDYSRRVVAQPAKVLRATNPDPELDPEE